MVDKILVRGARVHNLKNIDVDSLQEHIKTAQKALGFIEELTSKGASNVGSIPKGPKSPRPLDKFFGD